MEKKLVKKYKIEWDMWIWSTHDSDGTLESEITFDKYMSKLSECTYYKNGTVKSHTSYYLGKLNYKEFYSEGRVLISYENYDHTTGCLLYKRNYDERQRSLDMTCYHKNGNRKILIIYRDDDDSICGNKKLRETFYDEDDMITSLIFYYPDGETIKSTTKFDKDGIKVEEKLFNSDGSYRESIEEDCK